MRDTNRVGGVAALVQAVFFLLIPVAFLLVLPRMGLTLSEQSDPKYLLAFSTKNSLLMWLDGAMVIVAGAVVALALVLQDRLRDTAPFAMRAAVIAASIGAALLVASGVADIYDLAALREVFATNPAMATAAYAGVGTLAVGLFWAGLLAYGASVAMTSWAALRAASVAPARNYLGIAWGVLAVLSVFAYLSPTLFLLAMLVPIIGVIWAAWTAWEMLRASAPVRAGAGVGRQRPATPTA